MIKNNKQIHNELRQKMRMNRMGASKQKIHDTVSKKMEINTSIIIPWNKFINASGGYFQKDRGQSVKKIYQHQISMTNFGIEERNNFGSKKNHCQSSARKFFLSVIGGENKDNGNNLQIQDILLKLKK